MHYPVIMRKDKRQGDTLRKRRTGVTWTIAACTLLNLLITAKGEAEFQPGDVVDQVRWQEAKGMMPDAVLRHFAEGRHVSKVIEVPADALRWGTRYNQATVTLPLREGNDIKVNGNLDPQLFNYQGLIRFGK